MARQFDQWADTLRERDPTIDERALEGLWQNLFGGDFVFSVSRDFVRRNPIPLLILGGYDPLHPRAVSLELAQLAPAATLVEGWKAQPQRYLDPHLGLSRAPPGLSGAAAPSKLESQ